MPQLPPTDNFTNPLRSTQITEILKFQYSIVLGRELFA